MKKECRFPRREESGESREEKVANIVATEGDVSVISDDSYISLVSQESD